MALFHGQYAQKDPATTKIIVGMSGGVDSSVTALLLKEAGYAVEGLFMKNWEEDDGTEYCTAIEDLADARAVADRIDIPLNEANFAAEYWDNVFEHFLTEYKAGRTPNPDVLCNREIKFNVFKQYAEVLGADLIATGHYARLGDIDGELRLLRAVANNKDQSYFLQSVTQAQFEGVGFPLGDLEKPEVRAIATQHGLATSNKKDSTGICFIGERRFKDFLKTYLPAQPGNIVTLEGQQIGKHDGLMYHTLGQRQGLGIGGVKNAPDAPWYVVGKDLVANELIVAQGNNNPALFCRRLQTEVIEWIGPAPIKSGSMHCTVKTRYRQPDQACEIVVHEDHFEVIFEEPQRAVTPGQWACFYDGDVCLGGGIITQTMDNLAGLAA